MKNLADISAEKLLRFRPASAVIAVCDWGTFDALKCASFNHCSPKRFGEANDICSQSEASSGSNYVKSMESTRMGTLKILQPREEIGRTCSSTR